MPRISYGRATYWSFLLFLISIGCVALTRAWWPGVILIVGIPLAVRQFLVARYRDAIMTAVVFAGSYITIVYDIDWELFLPALFVLGAFYLFFNELTLYTTETEKEVEEDFLSDQESEFSVKKRRVLRKKTRSKARKPAQRRKTIRSR